MENAGITVKRHRQANPAHLTLFFFPFCFLPSVLSRRALLPFPLDMDELLQRLTEVSIRQQQIIEHLATRQGEAEQRLADLRTATAQRIPLPDPRVQATKLLPKLTPHDDVEAFLQMFESIATTEGWHPDDWARVLAPLLTGETQRAYFALPADSADQYVEVKKRSWPVSGFHQSVLLNTSTSGNISPVSQPVPRPLSSPDSRSIGCWRGPPRPARWPSGWW